VVACDRSSAVEAPLSSLSLFLALNRLVNLIVEGGLHRIHRALATWILVLKSSFVQVAKCNALVERARGIGVLRLSASSQAKKRLRSGWHGRGWKSPKAEVWGM